MFASATRLGPARGRGKRARRSQQSADCVLRANERNPRGVGGPVVRRHKSGERRGAGDKRLEATDASGWARSPSRRHNTVLSSSQTALPGQQNELARVWLKQRFGQFADASRTPAQGVRSNRVHRARVEVGQMVAAPIDARRSRPIHLAHEQVRAISLRSRDRKPSTRATLSPAFEHVDAGRCRVRRNRCVTRTQPSAPGRFGGDTNARGLGVGSEASPQDDATGER